MLHIDADKRKHWRIKPEYRWRYTWLGVLAVLVAAKLLVG